MYICSSVSSPGESRRLRHQEWPADHEEEPEGCWIQEEEWKEKQKTEQERDQREAKKATSPLKSKSRKREILASAGSSKAAAGSRKTRKTKNDENNADDGTDADASRTRARTPRAKAKTSAKPEKPAAHGKAKAKASPKNAAKPKANKPIKKDAEKPEKKRGRTPRKPGFELPANPLRDNNTVKDLMKFAMQFPEALEHDLPKLKKNILEAMSPLEWTKLMPYWSRNGCGVKVLQMDDNTYVDTMTFTFNASSAPRRYKLAIAVRCAELAVTWFKLTVKKYTPL